ncbi:MAG: phosphoenolpyruvate kinase [Acidobacteriota bacterium]
MQPVHVVYGGAHLFKASTCAKLGELARKAMTEFDLAAALGLSAEVAGHVTDKLQREPLEDFRIDFEDGFGTRPDDEEDATAVAAAKEMASAILPRFCGIRIKQGQRGLRTLRLFFDALTGPLPENFIVTLPKVTSTSEVVALAGALKHRAGIKVEIMIETPLAPARALELANAADGRCWAVHFGAYDYLASLGIAAQDLRHPACDYARLQMLTAVAGSGIWLADGATNQLPLPIHRGPSLTSDQRQQNREAIHSAWKLHYKNVRWGFYNGFYQGWDLHPAQIPARYAAAFSFFLEGMPKAIERLKSFVESAAKASHVQGAFDDAATGRGLRNYFRRAHACGLALDTDPLVTELERLLKIDTGNY